MLAVEGHVTMLMSEGITSVKVYMTQGLNVNKETYQAFTENKS